MTTVNTVLGPIAPEQLGVTLMHEHLLLDATPWFREPEAASLRAVAYQPVSIEVLGLLRNDPFMCRDNCELLDEATATEEVRRFRLAGGDTVVDPTCRGIGRDPRALQRIARATGLHVVMGTGYYLEPAHPPPRAGDEPRGDRRRDHAGRDRWRRRRPRRDHRRDRHLQRLHGRRREGAAGRGPRATCHRRAARSASAGMGAPRRAASSTSSPRKAATRGGRCFAT